MKPFVRFPFAATLAVLVLLAGRAADATPLTSGNLLVDYSNTDMDTAMVREYTPSGSLVQTFNVPNVTDRLRGLVVDANGNIDLFNGTPAPAMTTLNPTTGNVINSQTATGWGTVGVTLYGGLAAYANYVFAPADLAGGTYGNGIFRFDINSNSVMSFSSGNGLASNFSQAVIGQNGLLYGEAPGDSPGGYLISVFNPDTLALMGTINLGQGSRPTYYSIAVDASGDIYAVNGGNGVYEYDDNGNLLRTITVPGSGAYGGIVMSQSGQIALVATNNGTVDLTDTSFSNFSTLNVGGQGQYMFVNFVEAPLGVPEPSTWALLAIGGLALGGLAISKCRARRAALAVARR